jgi:WhiB family redox-sensing transcriptional regulator
VPSASEQWRHNAACREYPTEWWFGRDRIRAREICRACAVQEECLEYALARPGLPGIWAETTEEERVQMRATRQVVDTPPENRKLIATDR